MEHIFQVPTIIGRSAMGTHWNPVHQSMPRAIRPSMGTGSVGLVFFTLRLGKEGLYVNPRAAQRKKRLQ